MSEEITVIFTSDPEDNEKISSISRTAKSLNSIPEVTFNPAEEGSLSGITDTIKGVINYPKDIAVGSVEKVAKAISDWAIVRDRNRSKRKVELLAKNSTSITISGYDLKAGEAERIIKNFLKHTAK
jgi:hypothetical protein